MCLHVSDPYKSVKITLELKRLADFLIALDRPYGSKDVSGFSYSIILFFMSSSVPSVMLVRLSRYVKLLTSSIGLSCMNNLRLMIALILVD